MDLIHLPDVLQLEFLSFVESNEKLEYARVNRSLYHKLAKDVRQINMKRLKDFLASRLFEDRILQLMNRPEYQFNCNCVANYDRMTENLNFNAAITGFNILRCRPATLTRFFLGKIKQIQKLELELSCIEPSNLPDTIMKFEAIAKAIQSSDLMVNELQMSRLEYQIDFPRFPSISSLEINSCPLVVLEDLKLSQYSNLHSIKFYDCEKISDVSCLNHTKNLSFEFCDAITDISSLNFNYKISVVNCNGIVDYSKSFQYSTHIHVIASRKNIVPVEISSLRNVKTLNIGLKSVSVEAPLPKSLKTLQISNNQIIHFLPENDLTEVIISDCPSFTSLVNMDNIQRIELKNLPIKSLEGLGSRTRFLRIDSCSNITDYSLIHANCVVDLISHLKLIDMRSLTKGCDCTLNVNCVFLELNPLSFFEGVSKVKVHGIPTPSCFQSLTTLREIQIEINQFYIDDKHLAKLLTVLEVLCLLPNLMKIVLEDRQFGNSKSKETNAVKSFVVNRGFTYEKYGNSFVALRSKN